MQIHIPIEINESLDQEDMKEIKKRIELDQELDRVKGNPVADQYALIIDKGEIRIKKYYFDKEKPAARTADLQ